MTRAFHLTLATLALTCLASVGAQTAPVDPASFDLNGNGEIDQEELDVVKSFLNKELKRSKATRKTLGRTVKQSETQPLMAAKPAEDKTQKVESGLHIGLTLQEMDLLSGFDKFSPKDGALFSYNKDFSSGNDTLSGKGAVYYGIVSSATDDPSNDPASDNIVNIASGFLIGTSFDVVDDDAPGLLVDHLNFDLGYQQFLAGGSLFQANVVKLWLHHESDTELASSLVSVSADWTPYRGAPFALNYPQTPGSGYFTWATQFMMVGEAKTVLDEGDNPELADVDEIYGVGVVAGLDLWIYTTPFPDYVEDDAPVRTPLLHLYAGYSNAWGNLTLDDDYQGLFTASAALALDEKGIFSLEAVYRNGTIPFKGEEVDILNVGFGVKL